MRRRKSSLANKTIPKNRTTSCIVHNFNKYVSLVEDTFGMVFDAANKPILVKRFTWTNHNRISVSVITYGARVISMKVPDRGGNVEELLLGFDDLAGYLFYEKLRFGATIGRTTTKIYKSTYVVDGKQYWVTANHGEHQIYGGACGFDSVNWVPYVNGNVLHLSHTSLDGTEGYPGDLNVRMTFELTTGCEFKITMEANTNKITPIDLSNMIYFNLAGHAAGEDELRKHELLINANCFTPMDENNELPTGEIMNIVHTKFNFQVPKLLGEAMGPGPDSDFDQNYCVNRGIDQGNGFVARIIHPFKGRVLEIYSNQRAVNLSNGHDFLVGQVNIPQEILDIKPSITSQDFRENESLFIIVSKIAQYFREKLDMVPEDYHGFIRNLINKLLKNEPIRTSTSFSSELELIDTFDTQSEFAEFDLKMILRPLEIQFLVAMKQLIPYVTPDMPFDLVKDAIDDILLKQALSDTASRDESSSFIHNIVHRQISELKERISGDSHVFVQEGANAKILPRKSVFRHLQEAKQNSPPKHLRSGVAFPAFYRKDRIIGRGGVVYKRYSGISLRTQGYPNGLLEEAFPTPILRPHETYSHTVSYKFWILAGDPTRWLRRLEMGPCYEE